MNKLWWVIILAVVFIMGFYFIFRFYFIYVERTPTVVSFSRGLEFIMPKINPIQVAAQRPGNLIKVETVKLDKAGYLVVREITGTGTMTLGEIIGVSDLLPKGEYKNIVIKLDRMREVGEKMKIILYSDNGNSSFEESDDEQVRDKEGEVVGAEIQMKKV